MRKPRVTIRLSENQMLCLKELTDGLDTSISCLIRTIIGDFLNRNEEILERIVYGKNQPAAEED